LIGRLASVPAFFLFRVAAGLLLLKLSTNMLSVSGFAVFSQFMLFAALLNTMAIGGAQNGLIRQAAAAGDEQALGRAEGAALMIWGVVAPILALIIAFGSGRISHILVGTADRWWVVISIALLALAAGPGQIWCSLLTGRTRAASSLAAQASGLLAGTAMAATLIVRGDPAAATIGFASGSLVTMAIAFVLRTGLYVPKASRRAVRRETVVLLRYSAAFAATSTFSSLLLFGLRSLYREDFGSIALGYWLAANRISDTSTQLLGLFMTQFYVPHFTMLQSDAERRALTLRCWVAAIALMGSIPLVFSMISGPLVRIFLSPAYLPAVPAIRAYMIGDMFRVWACFAMFTAFARGHPGRYAAIEIGTLSLMAGITVLLIEIGETRAPLLAYAGAYGVTAMLVSAVFLWRKFIRRPR
jgi:O-antigen/teichoic acid export membrane protein